MVYPLPDRHISVAQEHRVRRGSEVLVVGRPVNARSHPDRDRLRNATRTLTRLLQLRTNCYDAPIAETGHKRPKSFTEDQCWRVLRATCSTQRRDKNCCDAPRTLSSSAYCDGFGYVTGIAAAGASHVSLRIGHLPGSAKVPRFTLVNTVLGNINSSCWP